MEISLIIPTYRRNAPLVDAIGCALAQQGVRHEVIVVDQKPDHDAATAAFLAEVEPCIRYVETGVASLTRARNLGAAQATGEVLVFVDDDTRFDPHFLLHHLEAHRQGHDVVQGRIIEAGFRQHRRPPWITPWLKFRGGADCLTDGPTNCVTGCNFSVSRAVFEALGGFDEGFVGRATREDSDFGYRAWRQGYRVWFSSRAVLHHLRVQFGGVKSPLAPHVFLDPTHYFCEMRFCRRHFPPWVNVLYGFRLRRRAARSIRRILREAAVELDRESIPLAGDRRSIRSLSYTRFEP